ncbi:hypothetical protein BH09VER1_BH09VER1_48960 [soil metagenome]
MKAFSILLALALPCSAQVDQATRWKSAQLRSIDLLRLDKAVALYQRTQIRYQAIEALRPQGVPAPIVFTFHGRESSWDFGAHLHEGSPLTHRTRDIPRGRPLHPDPPYTFEQSAEDALYILKHENQVNWRNLGAALQAMEAYNGLGYQRYHPSIPSPYLWAGTTLYTRGKYVRDGRFSAVTVDSQLGCAAILKRMKERGTGDWSKLPW